MPWARVVGILVAIGLASVIPAAISAGDDLEELDKHFREELEKVRKEDPELAWEMERQYKDLLSQGAPARSGGPRTPSPTRQSPPENISQPSVQQTPAHLPEGRSSIRRDMRATGGAHQDQGARTARDTLGGEDVQQGLERTLELQGIEREDRTLEARGL